MKRLILSLVAAACFAGNALAAAPPDTVTLPAKNGNITLNHKSHSGKLSCATCHASGTPGKIAIKGKDDGHKLCLECHQKNAGPTKCSECHKKS